MLNRSFQRKTTPTAYQRLSRLLGELGIAHADGRFGKLMRGFARTDLLVLDDWGLAKLTDPQPAARTRVR